jgi:hypothetical protein
MRGRITAALLILLGGALPASAATLDTGDGLQVTFSDSTGCVTAVSSNSTNISLLDGKWGGLAVQAGRRIAPANRLSMDFSAAGGPWTSARNADWNTGSFVTWQATGGIGDSGHLLLGDGTTAGGGMALTNPITGVGNARLKISWQAKVADPATLQILCVLVYDASGTDITASTPAPAGWGYSPTSAAHYISGIACSSANVWQKLEYTYLVSPSASSVRISLRYWNGGDAWVHVDDLKADVTGGIVWGSLTPVSGPIQAAGNGFTQSATLDNLQISTTATAGGGKLDFRIALQETSSPGEERPVLVYWTLPVATSGWQWWDDLDTARTIASGLYKSTFSIGTHAIGWYPYGAVSSNQHGFALSVLMSEPLVQRFECDPACGLSSRWEVGLSPVTTKLGAGRASFSCSLYAIDPAWGLRSASARYQAFYPQYFTKRTTAEGCWEWPVHPSQVPNPLDFGWVYHEAYPIDDASERTLCKQLGIGIYHYVEPWIFWDSWVGVTAKPTYEERVNRLTSWASMPGAEYVNWQASGGLSDTSHLLIGDGASGGVGMATQTLPVAGGNTIRISWQAKVANTATQQILGVRVYDASGVDITPGTAAPSGWGWTSSSMCHYVASIKCLTADTWQAFTYNYAVAPSAASVRVSLRYWNGGDGWVHVDDLKIQNVATGVALVNWDFSADGGGWWSADNGNWENPRNLWKREERQVAAQAVLNCLPADADGRYPIDASTYISKLDEVHNSYNQGWPVNPDPDLAAPSAYGVQLEHWVRERLSEADGLYIDSVTTGSGLGNWENRRPEHLAVSDSPLTFSWVDGGAAQLAPQAQEEFFLPVGQELHAQGKLFFFNLFPEATRFHAHQGDVQGCEVSLLVPPPAESRVQRAAAGKRVVTNLLQYNWDGPYASSAEVERYIRDELFWGFFPGISSIGGPMNGGAPDRYFLHPELYERDRSLFKHYMPVIRALGTAGWEPITSVSAVPAAEMERFGDFSRGPVYLTVRGADMAAYSGELTVNLTGCGLVRPSMQARVTDAFTGDEQPATRTDQRSSLTVAAEAGDVRVFRLEASGGIPDFDGDTDVDQEDFGHLQTCFSGADVPQNGAACRDARLDGDEDVDADDLSKFLLCLSGAGSAPVSNCLGE